MTATTITREVPAALATRLYLMHQMYPPPETPHPIILTNRQGLGDTVCLSAMIRDLCLTYPQHFKIWVRAQYPAVFTNNPYITHEPTRPELEADEFLVEVWPPEYHDYSPHMLHLFHKQFVKLTRNLRTEPPFPPLERGLEPLIHAGDIHLTADEISDASTHYLQYGNKPRWMIAAGGKTDFSTKLWPPSNYQRLVDLLQNEVQFYQIGRHDDVHTPLDNVVDLVGKLESRELIVLMYFMDGFVGPICGPMHLAAAAPTPTGRLRSIVTIGGGRESVQFYAYENHVPIHRVGHPAFDCAHGGACWTHDSSGIKEDYIGPQNKTVPKCKYPEPGGYARCMLHITPEEVAQAIRSQL